MLLYIIRAHCSSRGCHVRSFKVPRLSESHTASRAPVGSPMVHVCGATGCRSTPDKGAGEGDGVAAHGAIKEQQLALCLLWGLPHSIAAPTGHVTTRQQCIPSA